MSDFQLFQIDAFSREVFSGNPAAVIVLDQWLATDLMQQVAMENNLSETVFVCAVDGGFNIRWFTPQVEVDLCGHATLAAAYVLFKEQLAAGDRICFFSGSGPLSVTRDGELLALDFPSRPGVPLHDVAAFEEAIGASVTAAFQARDTLLILDSQQQVQGIKPDLVKLAALDTFAVIISAPGDDCDFVSRFFAPNAGINEDPVTGSAHCTLVPYWAKRLRKKQLHARQLSPRRGELFCREMGDRVSIGGYCCEYLRGTIFLPDG